MDTPDKQEWGFTGNTDRWDKQDRRRRMLWVVLYTIWLTLLGVVAWIAGWVAAGLGL